MSNFGNNEQKIKKSREEALPREISVVQNERIAPLRFTKPYPSVTSVIGRLANSPDLNEQTMLKIINPTKNIICISNNYGRNTNLDFAHLIVTKKKKAKKGNRLMSGIGEFAGTHFNSQTTYTILETDNMYEKRMALLKTIPKFKNTPIIEDVENTRQYKLFKVKHFRNGTIQIPGIIQEDLSDALEIMDIVIKELNISVTNAFKTGLITKDSFNKRIPSEFPIEIQNECDDIIDDLDLDCIVPSENHLPVVFQQEIQNIPVEKQQEEGIRQNGSISCEIVRENSLEFPVEVQQERENRKEIVLDYLSSSMRNYKALCYLEDNKRFNLQVIKDKVDTIKPQTKIIPDKFYYLNRIEYNSERYQGLLIRIYKPKDEKTEINFDKLNKILKSDEVKGITIKIFQEGKINIDSVNNFEEADIIYTWIKSIINIDNCLYTIDDDESNYYTSDSDGFATKI
jgi:hypothetical protein